MHYKMHGIVVALLYAEMMTVLEEFQEGEDAKQKSESGGWVPSTFQFSKAEGAMKSRAPHLPQHPGRVVTGEKMFTHNILDLIEPDKTDNQMNPLQSTSNRILSRIRA